MVEIGCSFFDEAVFDISWFDCIGLRPNIIQVKDKEIIKPIVSAIEQKRVKIQVSKDESIVKDSE